MRPDVVARPARFSIIFAPALRSNSTALSPSPPASCRAFLQSIMGRPVRSRSGFGQRPRKFLPSGITSGCVNVIRIAGGRLPPECRPRSSGSCRLPAIDDSVFPTKPQAASTRDPAIAAPSACSCFKPPAAALPATIASANKVTINSIERMLSSLPGIGRSTSSGSQSVSIKRQGGDAQLAGLANRVLFLARIDNQQALGQAVHGADTVEVAIHLAVFAVQRRLHLL